MKNINFLKLYKLCIFSDIKDFIFLIFLTKNLVLKYYKIKQDIKYSKDILSIKEIIFDIQNKTKNKLIVYNLQCFIDNIHVNNNSRTSYFSIRHLLKYICQENKIKYYEKKIDTNDIIEKIKIKNLKDTLNSIRSVCITLNVKNKYLDNMLYFSLRNKKFIDLLFLNI